MTTTGAAPPKRTLKKATGDDTHISKPTESAGPKTAQPAQEKAKTDNSAAHQASQNVSTILSTAADTNGGQDLSTITTAIHPSQAYPRSTDRHATTRFHDLMARLHPVANEEEVTKAAKKAKTNNSAAHQAPQPVLVDMSHKAEQEATEGDASTETTDSVAQEATEGDASTETTDSVAQEAAKAPQGTGAEGRKQQNRRQDMKPPGGHPNTKAADPTTQATWQRTHTISLVGVFRKVASVLGTPPGTTEALAGVLNRSKIIADITAQDDADLYATKQLRAALHGCSERILVVAGTSKPPYTNEAAATEESAPEGTFGDDDMVDILCKLPPHYKHCISGNVGPDIATLSCQEAQRQ